MLFALNWLSRGGSMEQASQKTHWMLDKDGLENLLSALHPDREQASQAYEALRDRLIRFFEWNRADSPEELADETLDRLARRLSMEVDGVSDPMKFAIGIARMLLKEHWRVVSRREEALVTLARDYREAISNQFEHHDREERVHTLERCLQSLPEPNRTLIHRYFSTESRTHILHRQKLAEEYGISLNALRNRVMRIRMEVERKFVQLESKAESGKIHRPK